MFGLEWYLIHIVHLLFLRDSLDTNRLLKAKEAQNIYFKIFDELMKNYLGLLNNLV